MIIKGEWSKFENVNPLTVVHLLCAARRDSWALCNSSGPLTPAVPRALPGTDEEGAALPVTDRYSGKPSFCLTLRRSSRTCLASRGYIQTGLIT